MRSHPWRLLAVLVLLTAVVIAGWVGWQGWHVNRDLSAAVDDAGTLQQAVTSGDDASAQQSLAGLRQHSSAAAERTNGATWSLLTKLPGVGDDAAGVRVVSNVIDDLSRDGIEPLVNTSRDLQSLLPKVGAISVPAIQALQGPVSSGGASFAKADEQLSAEDSSGYVEALQTKYRDLASRVSKARAVLTTADTALQVMPALLGEDGKRNYLLVFQNNAEIRATGGLPGALSLMTADNGKVELTKQVAANTFGEAAEPVLPLTDAEQKIYDKQLGTFFLDANFTPEFPRTADLMKARWEQVYPQKLDGVFSIDPVALSYILKATGPVDVKDGTLTSDNAVDELLHGAYLRYAKPADQDAYFQSVARAVFDKVSSGAESPQELIRALVRGADEHRLYVHSFQSEQQGLAGSEVAGEIVTDPTAAPQVGFYLNDGTGAKMSYYLRYDVQVDATSCNGGKQGLTGHARLVSDAPLDAASLPDYVTGAGVYDVKPGSQFVLVELYGPVGGEISKVQLNDKTIKGFPPVQSDGRGVSTVALDLKPRQVVDLTWQMTTGRQNSGDVQVGVTPSVVSGNSSSAVPSACS